MPIKIDATKFFQISLIAFVTIEIITWLGNQFNIGIEFLKGGFVIFLFLLVILLVTLWQFGINFNSLKVKDFIFMFLVLLIVVLLYIVLPQAIPQLFSSIPSQITSGNTLREFFTKTIGSIGSMMGTGV